MVKDVMVRPLEWRDLPKLHRIKSHGLCFDSQVAFTRGPHPLQSALLDTITPGRSASTLISAHESKRALTAIGQVELKGKGRVARLTFVAPEAALPLSNGLRLLEALASSAGQRGALGLIAETDEASKAFEALRTAGFAVYARQRIWRWRPSETDIGDPASENPWRPLRDQDSLAIKSLYHNLVPPLVKQVEEDPGSYTNGLAYWREAEILGFVTVDSGPLGTWVQAYFHPAVEDFDTLIRSALARMGNSSSPVHICVRSYQGWMNNPLENLGLSRLSDQAVMVKRLAARVLQTEEQLVPALEGTRAEPTAPFTPAIDQPSTTPEPASRRS